MQDNPHHHKYSKDFVDSQWSNMAELLDSNLPVDTAEQKSDRHGKKIVWLLSTLLFLSILSTVFYAYKFKSSIPSAGLIKESTVYKTIYLKADETSSEVKTNTAITTTKVVTAYNHYSSSELLSATSNEHDIISSDDLAITEVSDDKSSQLHSNLSALQLKRGLLESDNNKISIQASQSEPESIKKKKSIEYNIGLQAIVSTDFDYTGIGLQTGMLIPIGKKLGLNTGLAVNFISREQYFIDFFQRNQATSSSTLQDLSNSETYYNGLKSLKQIYIPIGMMYAFTKNLAINSGVKLRYTYHENVDKYLPPPPGGSRAPVQSTESLFNNANLGFTAGLRYKFNPHFSILLDSEWGLSKFITRSQFQNSDASRHDLNMINLTTNYTF